MRLYWKLFLWLAAALLATAGATTWLTHQWLTESHDVSERMNMLEQQAETAAELYESEGRQAYRGWLRATMRGLHIRGILLDAQGRHVLPEPIPGGMRHLVEQAHNDASPSRITNPPWLAVITPVRYNDSRYTWVAATRIPPHLLEKTAMQAWWIRGVASLLIVALISFLLSRIITRPVHQLQQTVHHFGKGDLSARARPRIGRQRDEIGDLAEHFDAMAEQIEQLINRQKQLLRDVSHELRSPLTRMQLALELAMQKDGDNAEELARIRKEGERIDGLIGDLLTLIRLESGSGVVEKEKISLAVLLTEIVYDAAFEAEQAGKHVTLFIEADPAIYGQAHLLQAALENIIRNAIRHTPEESAVEVLQQKKANGLLITISDHGPGVPEEALQRLFEPFYRVGEARDRQSGGFGIGLAIAARAIAAHGGAITAKNRPEGGLVVAIELPVSNSGEVTAQQH